MAFLKDLAVKLSAVASYMGSYFSEGDSYPPNGAVININTIHSFATHIPLSLDVGMGWANNNIQFTALHKYQGWYGDEIVEGMKKEFKISHRAAQCEFESEFYHFLGGKPISDEINCPHNTNCLFTASWAGSAWTVDRAMFGRKENRIPKHILQKIANITQEGSSHFILTKGLKKGKLYFNPLFLGLQCQTNTIVFPSRGKSYLKLSPLHLPSGLPDGVIGFS
ncbi:hypothetical protein DSO57_1021355 [Entomophthora muscae]|uniref:Uncharacterized protein n=1 Tax=Entomophthora muscae TaxID=34485 RepID=A0ACC2TE78_9FUNG|nr:hypothetical protein DSO57_1021355 [Entomophthora muscae]